MSDSRSMRFPAETAVLATVRDFAGQVAQELGSRIDPDVLAVVVGELTANAAVHQGGEAELVVTPQPDGGLVVAVQDPDPIIPHVIEGAPWDVTGHRGLQLVEAMSAAWGVDPLADGKRVWAQLLPLSSPVPPAPSPEPSANGRSRRRR